MSGVGAEATALPRGDGTSQQPDENESKYAAALSPSSVDQHVDPADVGLRLLVVLAVLEAAGDAGNAAAAAPAASRNVRRALFRTAARPPASPRSRERAATMIAACARARSVRSAVARTLQVVTAARVAAGVRAICRGAERQLTALELGSALLLERRGGELGDWYKVLVTKAGEQPCRPAVHEPRRPVQHELYYAVSSQWLVGVCMDTVERDATVRVLVREPAVPALAANFVALVSSPQPSADTSLCANPAGRALWRMQRILGMVSGAGNEDWVHQATRPADERGGTGKVTDECGERAAQARARRALRRTMFAAEARRFRAAQGDVLLAAGGKGEALPCIGDLVPRWPLRAPRPSPSAAALQAREATGPAAERASLARHGPLAAPASFDFYAAGGTARRAARGRGASSRLHDDARRGDLPRSIFEVEEEEEEEEGGEEEADGASRGSNGWEMPRVLVPPRRAVDSAGSAPARWPFDRPALVPGKLRVSEPPSSALDTQSGWVLTGARLSWHERGTCGAGGRWLTESALGGALLQECADCGPAHLNEDAVFAETAVDYSWFAAFEQMCADYVH